MMTDDWWQPVNEDQKNWSLWIKVIFVFFIFKGISAVLKDIQYVILGSHISTGSGDGRVLFYGVTSLLQPFVAAFLVGFFVKEKKVLLRAIALICLYSISINVREWIAVLASLVALIPFSVAVLLGRWCAYWTFKRKKA